MSHLLGHARAAKIIASALADEADECGDERHAYLLARLSRAMTRATATMEQTMRDEAGPGVEKGIGL